MAEKIKITKSVVDAIIEHAKQDSPIESCGYLAGNQREITKEYKMQNVDKSPVHFAFDPREQFSVLKKSRNEGLNIIANYHSHPESPAIPSEEDIKLAFDPNISYFIVSLENNNADLKAYNIVNNKVTNIELEILKY